jgi:hypothetical protein
MPNMTAECDEEIDWPAAPDQLRLAALPLIEVVMEMSADGSPERKVAMNEVLAAIDRIRAAMRVRPRLN